MDHIVVASIIPFTLWLLIYICKRCRTSLASLIAFPCLMAACSLWALIPDLPRLFGLHRLYAEHRADPRCDIFFWHYSIDLVDRDMLLPCAVLTVMAVLIFFAAWREIHLAERNR